MKGRDMLDGAPAVAESDTLEAATRQEWLKIARKVRMIDELWARLQLTGRSHASPVDSRPHASPVDRQVTRLTC